MERKSIHIILLDSDYEVNGKLVGIVDDKVIKELSSLVIEQEKLDKETLRLNNKKKQAYREANKFMGRIIKSHGVVYDDNVEAVGISRSDIIYVGEKNRVKQNPDAEPETNDIVKGKITKYERRKYNEHLLSFEFLQNKIVEHNTKAQENESKLVSFEENILLNETYDSNRDYLVVSSKTGKVFLLQKGE